MEKPNIRTLLLDVPLYEEFSVTNEDNEYLFNLQFYSGKLDYYCPHCNKESTFEGVNPIPSWRGKGYTDFSSVLSEFKNNLSTINDICLPYNQTIDVKFECTRNRHHKSVFTFYLYDKNKLQKIGQYPSIASLNQENLKKYRKILTVEQYKELNRGMGLTAHGVGIGAFVYLRRIFENLIEESHQEGLKNNEINESEYISGRMEDKIRLLKNLLPEFLYDNRAIYGILSKGIHELTEQECLEYFPIMRIGIELILDEKYEKHERIEKQKEIAKEIEKIKTKIK